MKTSVGTAATWHSLNRLAEKAALDNGNGNSGFERDISMTSLRDLSDNRNPKSWAIRFRQKRFAFFTSLLAQVPRPLKILDVGGAQLFWESMGFGHEPDIEIHILNLNPKHLTAHAGKGAPEAHKERTRFLHIEGDARHMPQFQDNEFDVAFSNSVIEHIGEAEQQRQMMREIIRVGKRYFVQTPNYYFPIEPHFQVVGFHYLPVSWRTWLLRHFDLGWKPRQRNPAEAEAVIRSVRLLTAAEFLALCPGAKLYRERLFGLTKSLTVYGGWK